MTNFYRVIGSVTLAFLLGACGGASLSDKVRFKNTTPVTKVNDRVDTPKKPEANPFVKLYYHSGTYTTQPLRETFNFNKPNRAENINALDEVPDSTWFTNRIGIRDMSPEEIGRGTNVANGPMDNKPWTCLLYTSPSPRDATLSRMPSSA